MKKAFLTLAAAAFVALGMVSCTDKDNDSTNTTNQAGQAGSLAKATFVSVQLTPNGGYAHSIWFSGNDTCVYAYGSVNADGDFTDSTILCGLYTYQAKGSGTINFYSDTNFTRSAGSATFSIDANNVLTLVYNGETVKMIKESEIPTPGDDTSAYAWLNYTQWQYLDQGETTTTDIFLFFENGEANLDLHLPSAFIYGGGSYTMVGNRGIIQFSGSQSNPASEETEPVRSIIYFEVMSDHEIDLTYSDYTFTLTRRESDK
ncbi:MAG: hypothetical protein IJU19_01255 [Bacteroidales bacterium]|nr:hypothetical protein [Bacteroidales bacterium]